MKTMNRIKNNALKLFTFSFLAISLFSCADDDDATPQQPISPNDAELITTVNLEFTDQNQNVSVFSFKDLDGDGGNPPVIDTIKLNKNQSYTVSAIFLDESDSNDVEDITEEILEEDDEHLICFDIENIDGLTIRRTDSDGTYEVGLASMWNVSDTAVATNGVVRLTLKHQPGVKDGSCAPGDTDVEVDFPVIFN